METVHLTIPDMTSPHCQTTVTHTVTAIGGRIKSIAPARAMIWLSDGLTRERVIEVIEKGRI